MTTTPVQNVAVHTLDLGDDRAVDRAVTGGKASALARALVSGAPVIPGFVLTVEGTAAIDAAGGDVTTVERTLREAWEELSEGGTRPVVARSSSAIEDAAESSMTGRYETVAGITTFHELVEAIGVVLDSRRGVAEGRDDLDTQHEIAVVVQRELDPTWGGIAFGVDPVTGRPDRRTVAVGTGAPEELVSGEEDGDTWVLDDEHEVVTEPDDPVTDISADTVQRVAALVDRVGRLFGGPQDVEWAADEDGTLWLLQSRPVTTEVTGEPTGPELGTGPIAETFPDALGALERDLWLVPLREAIATALPTAAIASERDVEDSPVLLHVDGRPAVDLELFGRSDRNSAPVRDRVRRIIASWRLGRLRSALPRAARRIIAETDASLAAVGPLDEYDDGQLLDLLRRSREVLRSVHGHEVLVGLITDPGGSDLTGSGVGIRALHAARREGLTDREAIVRDPAILALCPPRIGAEPSLPEVTDVPARGDTLPPADDPGLLREALRMRVRWVQELTVRAAELLGRRLVERDLLDEVASVRHVTLDALTAAALQGARPQLQPRPSDEPLPTRFRRTEDGAVVPVRGEDDGGTGAGGGTATGPVALYGDEPDAVPDGVVLLTPQLGPELAGVLPRLAGLVAETGSPLSHVAILAREHGVPTVVAANGVRDRFTEGDEVRVDGGSGEVEEVSS